MRKQPKQYDTQECRVFGLLVRDHGYKAVLNSSYRDDVLRSLMPRERNTFEGHVGHISTREELVAWCNNLARKEGVHQPDASKPNFYNCTTENFGR